MKRIPAVVLIVLAACGGGGDDGPTAVGNVPSSGLRFDFTGGGGGSFSAPAISGSPVSGSSAQTTTWAAAIRGSQATSGMTVFGNVARSNGTADEVLIGTANLTVGSIAVTAGCFPALGPACTGLVLVLGYADGGMTYSHLCTLASGTITVAAITSTTVAGSFSGTGTCVNPALTSSSFGVTNGEFNLLLVPGS